MSQSRVAEITSIEPLGKPMHELQPTNQLTAIMDNASLSSSTSSSSDSNNLSSPNTSIVSDQLLDHTHLKPGKHASLLSYEQTLSMYRENAKKTNNPDIQCDFALFLIDAGHHSEQQASHYFSEAEKILKQLSLKGHSIAQYQLAKLYSGDLLKNDPSKAFQLYVQASKRDHRDASFAAAECYEKGVGCRTNGTKAFTFYKKAASLCHPGAMYRLGLAYMNGDMGLSVNPKEAIKWLGRSVEAATPEYPEAIYKLANLYITGVPQFIFVDYNYSVSLLNQAAEMGYAPAAFKLGECYEYGKLNCQPDAALSIHYYTLAAEKGDRDACFALTAWYLVGSPNILPQSDEQAYTWAKRAAELGLPKAEYAIGYFSEMGIGCEKNNTVALEWYKKAAAHGDQRAIEKLKNPKSATPHNKNNTKKTNRRQESCRIM